MEAVRRAVLRIRADHEMEPRRGARVERPERADEAGAVRDIRDQVELRGRGPEAGRLDGRFVHPAREEVANELEVRPWRRSADGRRFHDGLARSEVRARD